MGQCAVDHVKTVLVFQLVFQTTDICFHSLKLKKKKSVLARVWGVSMVAVVVHAINLSTWRQR